MSESVLYFGLGNQTLSFPWDGKASKTKSTFITTSKILFGLLKTSRIPYMYVLYITNADSALTFSFFLE